VSSEDSASSASASSAVLSSFPAVPAALDVLPDPLQPVKADITMAAANNSASLLFIIENLLFCLNYIPSATVLGPTVFYSSS
jgi:hypothetical protein